MNTQAKASELHVTKLANLRLRQQILNTESLALERELFATYGNPDEDFAVQADGSIVRMPAAAPDPAVRGAGGEAPRPPKGKGAHKPGGR